MSDEPEALAGSAEPIVSYETIDDTPQSVEEAARSLTDARNKVVAQANKPAESAEAATAGNESADEADAAPLEEATGETQEDAPAEEPQRELPRSWTKDRAEHWAKLDPDTQDFLLEQDRKASAEVRRVQNEAAEKLKGLTAKEQQAEQARQQYESRQTEYTKALETALQADFGDIQSLADVRKMQAEDPFRFQSWQLRQMELSAAQAEKQQVDRRKAEEKQTETRARKEREHSLLIEKAPEFADAKKLKAAQDAAVELFREKGVTDEWFRENAENPILDDHHFQLIIADALKYRDIQKAPKPVATKPVPPVLRPGARPTANNNVTTQIQALEKQLETASGDKAARISADIYRLEKRAKSA